MFESLEERFKRMGSAPATPGAAVARYLGVLALSAVLFGTLLLAIMLLEF